MSKSTMRNFFIEAVVGGFLSIAAFNRIRSIFFLFQRSNKSTK